MRAVAAEAGAGDPGGIRARPASIQDRFRPNGIAEADAVLRMAEPTSPSTRSRRPTWSRSQDVARQGYAGLLWSKQFYHYVIREWLNGDPGQPKPPPERLGGRNREWPHLFNRDIISMPDKWEYPWFAAWDLAFHMMPMAKVDPHFAKKQLELFLREWYMHPNGQIPAYEFAFGDVNPPVHAWAAWRVYKMTGPRGQRDRAVSRKHVFQKLMLNFTWWVNRKDAEGNNLFSGGFLGLDNIGVFDRSKPLPDRRLSPAGRRHRVDGFLLPDHALDGAGAGARTNPVYEDMASKFFEHFIADRRRHEHDRRHRAVGRGGRLLLRQTQDAGWARDSAAHALAGRAAAADRGGSDRELEDREAAPASRSGWIGS